MRGCLSSVLVNFPVRRKPPMDAMERFSLELGSGKTLLDHQKSLGRPCSGRGLTTGSPA